MRWPRRRVACAPPGVAAEESLHRMSHGRSHSRPSRRRQGVVVGMGVGYGSLLSYV